MARKKPAEQVSGGFGAVPHAMLDGQAYSGASHPSRSLLMEFVRQHNGRNNGHLHAATGWLKKRGWLSAGVIQRAKTELLNRKLIIKTRAGGLNAGADLYALTWLPISDYAGLDLRAGQYHPGAWNCFIEPPKQKKPSLIGNSTALSEGIATTPTAPPERTKTALFEGVAILSERNNVVTNVSSLKKHVRIVGKPGKSGAKTTAKKISPESTEYHQ